MKYYLRITLHDTDFNIELGAVGKALKNLLQWFGCPDEINLQALQVCVQGLLYNANKIQNLLRRKRTDKIKLEDFRPTVEIVDASQILDWDGGESLYIQINCSPSEEQEMFFR